MVNVVIESVCHFYGSDVIVRKGCNDTLYLFANEKGRRFFFIEIFLVTFLSEQWMMWSSFFSFPTRHGLRVLWE